MGKDFLDALKRAWDTGGWWGVVFGLAGGAGTLLLSGAQCPTSPINGQAMCSGSAGFVVLWITIIGMAGGAYIGALARQGYLDYRKRKTGQEDTPED